MLLTRKLTDFLTDFYANQKTALMLTGARQTGKTFAIRELGKSFDSFGEINFIITPEAINLQNGFIGPSVSHGSSISGIN